MSTEIVELFFDSRGWAIDPTRPRSADGTPFMILNTPRVLWKGHSGVKRTNMLCIHREGRVVRIVSAEIMPGEDAERWALDADYDDAVLSMTVKPRERKDANLTQFRLRIVAQEEEREHAFELDVLTMAEDEFDRRFYHQEIVPLYGEWPSARRFLEDLEDERPISVQPECLAWDERVERSILEERKCRADRDKREEEESSAWTVIWNGCWVSFPQMTSTLIGQGELVWLPPNSRPYARFPSHADAVEAMHWLRAERPDVRIVHPMDELCPLVGDWAIVPVCRISPRGYVPSCTPAFETCADFIRSEQDKHK